MEEKKHETEKNNTFDVETLIKASVNVMFTQMQSTQGFKLFGAVAGVDGSDRKSVEQTLCLGR